MINSYLKESKSYSKHKELWVSESLHLIRSNLLMKVSFIRMIDLKNKIFSQRGNIAHLQRNFTPTPLKRKYEHKVQRIVLNLMSQVLINHQISIRICKILNNPSEHLTVSVL